MDAQLHPDAPIILCSDEQWTAWLHQIQSCAVAYNIWDNINPDHPVPFLEKPKTPDVLTRGCKASEEDRDYRSILHDRFMLEFDEYSIEQENKHHLFDLIVSTVESHLQASYFNPDRSLHEWISALKGALWIDDLSEKERARKRYHEALEPMQNPQHWNAWLAEYNEAASLAKLHGVPEVLQIHALMKDFSSSVANIAPRWAATFLDIGSFEPLMSRKEMVRRFREHMKVQYPLDLGKPRAGASATADDGAATRGNKRNASSAADNAPPVKRNKQRKAPPHSSSQASSKKRQRGREPANSGERCPACGERHGIKGCYYIHQELAPRWWKPKRSTQSLIELRSKNDTAFQALLREEGKSFST
ncbi:hypothetical protein E4U19_004943 [Claviceps sp. Clav32 group G5]|nr:hypothetical protein E4U19_004943 [Claviceps sp. Clav32 group G5]KAG6049529.1 hypothetical protein E4U39_005904 [Claviceps sp. Clav50 group G5]